MNDNDFIDFLKQNGYFEIRQIPGRGWCALSDEMIFTVDLFYDLKETHRNGRYSYQYQDRKEAIKDIHNWNGVGDPPGPWIYHKIDGVEHWNPAFRSK
jgi:hypothetical protein